MGNEALQRGQVVEVRTSVMKDGEASRLGIVAGDWNPDPVANVGPVIVLIGRGRYRSVEREDVEVVGDILIRGVTPEQETRSTGETAFSVPDRLEQVRLLTDAEDPAAAILLLTDEVEELRNEVAALRDSRDLRKVRTVGTEQKILEVVIDLSEQDDYSDFGPFLPDEV